MAQDWDIVFLHTYHEDNVAAGHAFLHGHRLVYYDLPPTEIVKTIEDDTIGVLLSRLVASTGLSSTL